MHELQEKLAADAERASLEATSFEDLATTVLPLLDRAFDARSHLYMRDNGGRFRDLGGALDGFDEYMRTHYPSDPMQALMRDTNPWIFHAARYPQWAEFLRLPAHEFLAKRGIGTYLHVRLTNTPYHQPGMAGILIARPVRQPDFIERDELLLARLLPSLHALTRRSLHLEDRLHGQSVIEAIIEADPRASVALALAGHLLWASPQAKALLGDGVPEALAQAAGRLAGVERGSHAERRCSSVTVQTEGGARVRAELRLIRTRAGAPFVLTQIESDLPRGLPEVARLADLTNAESEVLKWLARGLSNREIARRRFVSESTAQTHVIRILAKLGVKSRVRAALLAHGLSPEGDD